MILLLLPSLSMMLLLIPSLLLPSLTCKKKLKLALFAKFAGIKSISPACVQTQPRKSLKFRHSLSYYNTITMTYHCLPFFPCYLLSQAMPAIQAAAERFGHRSQLLPQLAAASSARAVRQAGRHGRWRGLPSRDWVELMQCSSKIVYDGLRSLGKNELSPIGWLCLCDILTHGPYFWTGKR